MYCIKCRKKFYIKRGFLDLFETKEKYICDKCYSENPISLKAEKIMLENNEIMIVSMFDSIFKIDLNPYFIEINQIYNYFNNNYIGFKILILDEIVLSLFNLEILNFWVESFNEKLIVLCGVIRK